MGTEIMNEVWDSEQDLILDVLDWKHINRERGKLSNDVEHNLKMSYDF